MRQVSGTFPGKRGIAFLLYQVTEEDWDEAAVEKLILSLDEDGAGRRIDQEEATELEEATEPADGDDATTPEAASAGDDEPASDDDPASETSDEEAAPAEPTDDEAAADAEPS
ncbi:MAG: hypothetical protein ACF8TS_01740 [Maioricimonas sp. JB049]